MMPLMIFISVDLPAPFSPTSAWISPALRSKSIPWRTLTPSNALVMPRAASTTASPSLGEASMDVLRWAGALCLLFIEHASMRSQGRQGASACRRAAARTDVGGSDAEAAYDFHEGDEPRLGH